MGKSKILIYLSELRAPFFTASIVPIILGSVVAWQREGAFSWWLFFLTLVGGIALQAGANVANDYYDHKSGNDEINKDFVRPFTGGSRMIQNGLMSPREVLVESLTCYAIALVIGLYLIYVKGPTILWLGIIGAFSGFFYTAPPFKLVHRGIGEFFIGLNFGILMCLGAYFVQTGNLSLQPVIVAIPIALLIILVLYINEFTDFNADKAVKKNHLVVRLGLKRSSVGYVILLASTYTTIIIGILLGSIPYWGFITLLTLPLAVKASKTALKFHSDPSRLVPANAATIQLHLSIGLLLAIGFIADKFLG